MATSAATKNQHPSATSELTITGLFSSGLPRRDPLRSFDFIQSSDDLVYRSGEYFADSEERSQSDRLTCLHLLPIPDGISLGNHVFLAVAGVLAQFLDSRP